MKRLILKLRSPKYRRLFDILAFLTLALPLIIIFGGETVFRGNEVLTKVSYRLGMVLLCFLMGCLGFVAMIRKELRQAVMIRGKPAQITGAVLWISSWASIVYIVIWSLLNP